MTPKLSIILYAHPRMPYEIPAFARMIVSLQNQYEQNFEVLVFGDHADARAITEKAGYTFLPSVLDHKAKALNVALRQCRGEYVLICSNETNALEFKRSATKFYAMAMDRHPETSLLYSDYDLIDKGIHKERKLQEWHPGRLTEAWDTGYCLLYSRRFLESAGFCDERYRFNPLNDLRFKAMESGKILHISNRFNGVPYLVFAAEQGLDVFAYLKAGKEVQLENEQILTEHLKRIKAYLAPGAHYHKVEYTPEEEATFKTCIAAVVIPVYNRPEFIGPAIESVQAQTVQNIEIVVVCNGGEQDPTIAEIRRYQPGGDHYSAHKPPVRLIIHDMNVLGLCFNDALQTSRAKYYVQLDSDDLLFPEAIEKILRVYDQDERIGMVIGSYQVFEKKADGRIEPVLVDGKPFIVTHDEWTEENGRNNLLRIGGAGAPRSIKIKVLKELGWFGMNDAPYSRNYGEDYELVNKCAERFRIGRVWDPIYKVVRHSGGTDHMIDQVTIDVNENAKDYMRLVALRRRQKLNGLEPTV
ncbi:MAG TPA: glycosyltransferase [bacterium]|nr:glycosyltransferase [bacterium]HQG44505.1 glycosyltransferase [bacterium]HQI48069.1 glycosyltransferase [bacterium]HQJ63313.1 glycosyltransferase [bacterium]